MICENCNANVPKIYQGADGRKYCCPHCLFNPLGCRCQFGELGVAEETDYGQFDDDDDDNDDFDEYESSRTCPDCWHTEEFCECGELPPEAKHDGDCPCKCCQPVSHCCENNLHFDCSGSVIDDTDGKFNHRGKCFCECHLSRTEKHRFESTDAVDTIPPQVKNSAASL